MPIIKQSETSYTLIPPGNYPARCYGVVSLGTQQPSNPQFSAQFKVVLMFEFPTETIERDGKTKPLGITQFLNAYLGSSKKPSKTAQFLTAWRGKPFTEAELKGFDLAKVIGVPCLISITHEDKGGKIREVISSIAPPLKGMAIPPQFNPSVHYEVEDKRNEVFNALPEWMRKMIEASDEFTGKVSGDDVDNAAADAEALAQEKKADEVPL